MSIVTTDEIKAFLQASGVELQANALAMIAIVQPMVEALIEERIGYAVAQATYTEYYPVGQTNRYQQDEANLLSYEKTPSGMVVGTSRWAREQKYLQLATIPVRSITSVYENYAAYNGGTPNGDWPSTTLLNPTSYYLDLESDSFCWTGQLIRNYGVWASQQRCVKVTYVAGFTTQELATKYAPIRFATLIAIQDAFIDIMSKSVTGGLGGVPASVGIEDFSVSFNTLASQSSSGGASAGSLALSPRASAMLMPYIRMRKYFGIM